MKHLTIGVLAFQGDVTEHIHATRQAIKNLHRDGSVIEVRTMDNLRLINGLIIPGGESTVLYKLTQREGFFEEIKQVPYIMGTCAGAIMLAKTVLHKEDGQKTLELMDITVERNAYGRQTESFETPLETSLGPIPAIFIRAPKITAIESTVHELTKHNGEIVGCEQKTETTHYIALTFHPELTTTIVHEYFLKSISE
jgi:5'-phosphate synthase pdxT subunit